MERPLQAILQAIQEFQSRVETKTTFSQLSYEEKAACARWCLEEHPDIAHRFHTTQERFTEEMFTECIERRLAR